MKSKGLYRARNILKRPLELIPSRLRRVPLSRINQVFDFAVFRQMQMESGERRLVRWRDRRFLSDADPEKHFDAHYIYHTSWAARKLQESPPERHVDFSSSLYFAGIVSAFIPTMFCDFRPVELGLKGFSGKACDLLNLSFADESFKSVSCMHVIEHVGLGRYGDPLSPNGDHASASELQRVTSPSGRLLIVVPVGRPHIAFNAHRVYAFSEVVEMFASCDLRSNALLPDDSGQGLLYDADPPDFDRQRYGCGCFEFVKKSS